MCVVFIKKKKKFEWLIICIFCKHKISYFKFELFYFFCVLTIYLNKKKQFQSKFEDNLNYLV